MGEAGLISGHVRQVTMREDARAFACDASHRKGHRMVHPWRWRLLSLAMFLSCAAPASAGPCKLNKLSIDPISPSNRDHLVGSGKFVDLDFINERVAEPVEVFPEPPLTVRQKATGKKCEIDGGIWVRNAVYLNDNEAVLATQEYSGSNDRLVFYDTATCKKKAELDVSGAVWELKASEVLVGRHCTDKNLSSCRAIQRYRLDAQCNPKRARSE
jgi:hypothetical protein